MAEDPHDPHTTPAPSAEEPTAAPEDVVEAELVEVETIEVTTVEAEPVDVEPALVEPVVVEPVDPAAQAGASLAAAAAAAAAATGGAAAETSPPAAAPPAVEPVWQIDQAATGAQPQYVVVEAPQVPIKRGNRGIGALLALAGAVIYGGLLIGVAYVLEALSGRAGVAFLQDWHFYLPVGIFAVAFIVLVVLVNRATWWAYILGSVFVGLAVYFGTAGGNMLIEQWTRTAEPQGFAEGLMTPFVILAGILGREVAVWWGSLIAMRGRRVTARNRAEREAFDRELAEFRARYGG